MDPFTLTLVLVLLVIMAWLAALTYLGNLERRELRRQIDLLALKLAAAHVERAPRARRKAEAAPPAPALEVLPKRAPVLEMPPELAMGDEAELETHVFKRAMA